MRGDKKKTVRLNCRVSIEEKEEVEKRAVEKDMNLSEYIRAELFCRPVVGVTVQDLDTVARDLTYQVRKIGVNINQLAKAANGRYFQNRDRENLFLEQEMLVSLLEKYIEKLDRVKEKGSE